MDEYVEIINWENVLDVIEGKITVKDLREKILKSYYRFCRDENEKEEALQYVDKAFEFISPFLAKITLEEYQVLSRYGGKIGTNSYEINEALRNNKPLSYENKYTVKVLDRVIDKFQLNEDTTVYRALKPKDGMDWKFEDIIGRNFVDEGYMSTSLTKENSYAYFKEYDVVLEIKLPAGSKCVYLEWFKGTNDEKELLLGRGTTLSINSMRKEIINGNEKIVYSCDAREIELQTDVIEDDTERN